MFAPGTRLVGRSRAVATLRRSTSQFRICSDIHMWRWFTCPRLAHITNHAPRSASASRCGPGFPADYVLGIAYPMLSCVDANAHRNCRKSVQVERLRHGTGYELGKTAGRLYSERTTTCQPIESLRLDVRPHTSQLQRARPRNAQEAAASEQPPGAGVARSGHGPFVRRSPQPNPYAGRPPWRSFCSRSCTWMTASRSYSALASKSCRNGNTRRLSQWL